MRGYPVLTGAAAALIASLAGALAQQPAQPVKVGVLECRGGASVGFIVGSVTNLGCVLPSTVRRTIVISPPSARSASISASRRSRHWPGASTRRWRGSGRRSLRQLCRRPRQRLDRHRPWWQRPDRRLRQFDRVAAAQRAGSGRPQRRGRFGRIGIAAGPVKTMSRITALIILAVAIAGSAIASDERLRSVACCMQTSIGRIFALSSILSLSSAIMPSPTGRRAGAAGAHCSGGRGGGPSFFAAAMKSRCGSASAHRDAGGGGSNPGGAPARRRKRHSRGASRNVEHVSGTIQMGGSDPVPHHGAE